MRPDGEIGGRDEAGTTLPALIPAVRGLMSPKIVVTDAQTWLGFRRSQVTGLSHRLIETCVFRIHFGAPHRIHDYGWRVRRAAAGR